MSVPVPPDELTGVLTAFGLSLAGPPVILEGGEDNLNLKVPTPDREVVLRRYELVGFPEADAELHFAAHLARQGYPTPAPLPRTGGGFLESWAGRPAAVFPFVRGRVPDATDVALARRMGGLLGSLHRLGDSWPGHLPVIDRLGLLRGVGEPSRPLAGWQDWRAAVAGFFTRNGDRLTALLPRLPGGPIHHDLHRRNLLVRGEDGEVVAVLDFGEINRAAYVLDLVRTCHYLAAEAPALHLPAELAYALCAGYETVRPLTAAEREALPVLFDLVNLVDAVTFLADPPDDVSAVGECRSLQLYWANANGTGGALAGST